MTRVELAGLVSLVLALGAGMFLIGADADPSAVPPATPAPTFASEIAPIVYDHCVSCHRPGQAAPFPLLTYEDARKRGQEMADATRDRYMPPWHASRAEGFLELKDDRTLTATEISTIRQWVDAGMPSGNLRLAPAPPAVPSTWALGEPDLIVMLPQPVEVPPDGRDQYRNIAIAVNLPDDRWIKAIDYRPSARSVVHHALYFTTPAGAIIRDSDAVPGLSASAPDGRRGLGRYDGAVPARLSEAAEAWGNLGAWVPGAMPRFFPEGIGQPFPKHTNLVIQLHVHPTGRAETEQGAIALYFSKERPHRSLTGVHVPPTFGVGMGIDIPAGERRYVIRDSFVLPVDAEAFGVRGHAHYLGREMKMTATLPDGSTRGLLWIEDWDFNWQDSYFYKEKLALPQGTRLDVEIVYDNSAENSHNPNSPPARVRWGRESSDEMGSMILLVTTATPEDQQTLRAAQAAHLRQQVLLRPR